MKKTASKPQPPKQRRTQFWVIDTDTLGQSAGQFSTSGPFASHAEAETFIAKETLELWESSCACLASDSKAKWCGPLHIVKTMRTVQPKIKGVVKLLTVKP